jgi:hypothetical protein
MSAYLTSPPQEYTQALEIALKISNVDRNDPERYLTFCAGFAEGWRASKMNTLQILDSIARDGPGDQGNGSQAP